MKEFKGRGFRYPPPPLLLLIGSLAKPDEPRGHSSDHSL